VRGGRKEGVGVVEITESRHFDLGGRSDVYEGEKVFDSQQRIHTSRLILPLPQPSKSAYTHKHFLLGKQHTTENERILLITSVEIVWFGSALAMQRSILFLRATRSVGDVW